MDGGTKLSKKHLKKGKLFAIHHLTRRVQQLRNKSGTEKQREKNIRKADRLQAEMEYIKDFEVADVICKIEKQPTIVNGCTTMDQISDIKERALIRLILSKPIRSQMEPEQVEIQSEETRKRKLGRKNGRIEVKISSDGDGKKISGNDIIERKQSSFFIQNMSSFTEGKMRNKPSKTQQKSKKKEPKKSSNRLGQRARQRLWEKQFGKAAKHVKTTKNQTFTKEAQKRRLKTDKKGCNVLTSDHPSWEASKRRKQQSNISETKFQGQKIIFDED